MVAKQSFVENGTVVRGRPGPRPTPIEKVVAAVISNPTLSAAAAALGVNRKTVWRIARSPEFKSRYRATRKEMVTQAIAMMQNGTEDAVRAVHRLVTGRKVPAGVRLQAASKVIEVSLRAVEQEDFEERLCALESDAPALSQQEIDQLETEVSDDIEDDLEANHETDEPGAEAGDDNPFETGQAEDNG